MKRYQCIKNWYTFTQGGTFPAIEGPPSHEGGADLIGPNGRIYEVTRQQLFDHFQELLDLNVDDMDAVYADQENLDYVLMQQAPGCTRTGLAICAVVVITLLIIAYKIFG